MNKRGKIYSKKLRINLIDLEKIKNICYPISNKRFSLFKIFTTNKKVELVKYLEGGIMRDDKKYSELKEYEGNDEYLEDKATVPLYYENRGDKIEAIKNPEINEKILEAIEAADLDPEQQEKLEREFAKEIHILTAEPRLDAIAKDFVNHYTDLWTSGKAIVRAA